jgi:hypothetical protein
MDPIQPIEPRSRWISELAPPQTQGAARERRKSPRGADRKGDPRRKPPGEEREPEDKGPEGRHIDVRA